MSQQPMKLFITFEGIDGSGKTTQARALNRNLLKSGHPVLLTQEPRGTPLGKRLWTVLTRSPDLSPEAELLLFAAARVEHVTQVIGPALAKGITVICDRFIDSTMAYQGYGRGLPSQLVEKVNTIATVGFRPTRTFLLDLPAEENLRRQGNSLEDPFEKESAAFRLRLQTGFRAMAEREPSRFISVDANAPKRKISDQIWDIVRKLIDDQG